MPTLAPEAKIVERDGKRQWVCPSCGQVLGVVTVETVVIEDGRRTIAIAKPEQVQQWCPRKGCRASSYVTMEVLAR